MIQAVGLGLVAYLLFRKDKKDKKEPMTPPPQAVPTGEDSWRVTFIESGEDGNGIYELESASGLVYEDGRDERQWSNAGYITGAEGVGYLSAPSDIGGTVTFEIEGMLYENVLVYSTLDKARDATALPDESDPNQPAKPEEPEEDGGEDGIPFQPPTTLPGAGVGVSWNSGWY